MITNQKKKHIRIYKKNIIIGTIAGIVLCCIWYVNIKERKFANTIYPNIYINNIPVGGKTVKQALSPYQKQNKVIQQYAVIALYKNQKIATFSAQMLGVHSNADEIISRAYQMGRNKQGIKGFFEKYGILFGLKRNNLTTTILFDKSPIHDFINTTEDLYNKPAKNALFSFEDGRVKEFRTEEKGLKIKTDVFVSDFDLAIAKLVKTLSNQSIILKDQIIEPEITLAKANKYGIEELIGEGKSDFTHSIPERIHNIKVGSAKFNGVLVPRNQIFSFNKTIGDISAQTGYKPAYIIKAGRTVLGDGGGVCQISSTLFRAALNTGLPIVERFAHAYRVSYYENDGKPGFDATVFDPEADFKFKNDTPSSILIQTEIDLENNLLYFRLYGKKDNRKVSISPVTVYDIQAPPPPVYQDDPTIKRGITKQVDFPAWGSKAKFDYKVTRNKDVIFEKTFFSNYRPWAAVFLVGIMD